MNSQVRVPRSLTARELTMEELALCMDLGYHHPLVIKHRLGLSDFLKAQNLDVLLSTEFVCALHPYPTHTDIVVGVSGPCTLRYHYSSYEQAYCALRKWAASESELPEGSTGVTMADPLLFSNNG